MKCRTYATKQEKGFFNPFPFSSVTGNDLLILPWDLYCGSKSTERAFFMRDGDGTCVSVRYTGYILIYMYYRACIKGRGTEDKNKTRTLHDA